MVVGEGGAVGTMSMLGYLWPMVISLFGP